MRYTGNEVHRPMKYTFVVEIEARSFNAAKTKMDALRKVSETLTACVVCDARGCEFCAKVKS